MPQHIHNFYFVWEKSSTNRGVRNKFYGGENAFVEAYTQTYYVQLPGATLIKISIRIKKYKSTFYIFQGDAWYSLIIWTLF